MTQVKKLTLILSIVILVAIGVVTWVLVIAPSADITREELTLAGTLRAVSTNQAATSQYQFQTSTTTYQVRPEEQVATFIQGLTLPQAVVIKGRVIERPTFIVEVRDLSLAPSATPLTLTGTIKRTNEYDDRPYSFTAHGLEYRTRLVAPAQINLDQAATLGQTISVTGLSYYYQFLSESYREYDVFDAIEADL